MRLKLRKPVPVFLRGRGDKRNQRKTTIMNQTSEKFLFSGVKNNFICHFILGKQCEYLSLPQSCYVKASYVVDFSLKVLS